jgi:endonuclease/exonuclease/phosphatase family metal-dependent hydrolase
MTLIIRMLLIAISAAQVGCSTLVKDPKPLRVATFNVSIEATNYLSREELAKNPSLANVVHRELDTAQNPQMRNIAEIVQRTRPDIILLNEFDYVEDSSMGIQLFMDNYLQVSQNGLSPITYPYFYIAPVNTGIATKHDLDNNGTSSGNAGDAYGFGYYPGQYGMALLSRHPIKQDGIRTFQRFLWKDMPDALKPQNPDLSNWYNTEEWAEFRLSSKSHWDIPVHTNNGIVHIIASHPTPPTFDGPEDRNGRRNHDEIRLIRDYIDNQAYLYDDSMQKGGLNENSRFIIVGDLNSSPDEGDSIKQGIRSLLEHPFVNSSCAPSSKAGQANRSENPFAANHTAQWGARADYAVPSKHGLEVLNCGVYWPSKDEPQHSLVETRNASSDHRLVWLDVLLK